MAVNLLTASVDQIQLIHRVGLARANAIVRLREEKGLSIQGLVEVTKLTGEFWRNLLDNGYVTLGKAWSEEREEGEWSDSEAGVLFKSLPTRGRMETQPPPFRGQTPRASGGAHSDEQFLADIRSEIAGIGQAIGKTASETCQAQDDIICKLVEEVASLKRDMMIDRQNAKMAKLRHERELDCMEERLKEQLRLEIDTKLVGMMELVEELREEVRVVKEDARKCKVSPPPFTENVHTAQHYQPACYSHNPIQPSHPGTPAERFQTLSNHTQSQHRRQSHSSQSNATLYRESKRISPTHEQTTDDESEYDTARDNVAPQRTRDPRSFSSHQSVSRQGQNRRSLGADGPAPPKMQTFHGEPTKWRSFLFQFEQMSSSYGWSAEVKREKLMSCMRDRAVEFLETRPAEVLEDYDLLLKDLKQRYGHKTSARASRRELGFVHQGESEDVEEFAERVHRLAIDGHPGVDSQNVQSIAVDAFFRGCRDKLPAMIVMASKPRSLSQAVSRLNEAIQDQKVLGKHHVVRQVKFDDAIPTQPVRADASVEKSDELVQLIQAAVKQAFDAKANDSKGAASTSPKPCFSCGQAGHFSRECPRRSRSPSPARNGLSCYRCGLTGHFARDCQSERVATTPAVQSPNRQVSQSLSPVRKDSLNC